jgi:hypothetical protein
MSPSHLAMFDEELAANLIERPTVKSIESALEGLYNAPRGPCSRRLVHVLGFGSKIEGFRHSKLVIELARWLGIDGKRALRLSLIHLDQIGSTATDDNDESGVLQVKKLVGADIPREGAKVRLAVLRERDALVSMDFKNGQSRKEDFVPRRKSVARR